MIGRTEVRCLRWASEASRSIMEECKDNLHQLITTLIMYPCGSTLVEPCRQKMALRTLRRDTNSISAPPSLGMENTSEGRECLVNFVNCAQLFVGVYIFPVQRFSGEGDLSPCSLHKSHVVTRGITRVFTEARMRKSTQPHIRVSALCLLVSLRYKRGSSSLILLLLRSTVISIVVIIIILILMIIVARRNNEATHCLGWKEASG